MEKKKYIAIGDVHGCAETLKALIEKLDVYGNRSFVFLGDYIDRGPNSREVVDYLLDFREEADCIFLRGNHEQMMLDAIDDGDTSLWIMNGGRETIDSYERDGQRFKLSKAHRKFYEQTKFYYQTDDYFFVHAGLSPDKTIAESLDDEQEIDKFLWERSHLNSMDKPWEKTVIFGHTPRPEPVQDSKMIGIDTGCVYQRVGYGKLTAVKLPEKEFIQQECID